MKAGDRVQIYFDPLDEFLVEEEVTLVEFQQTAGWYGSREMQWWLVRFDDGDQALRKILAPYEEGQ